MVIATKLQFLEVTPYLFYVALLPACMNRQEMLHKPVTWGKRITPKSKSGLLHPYYSKCSQARLHHKQPLAKCLQHLEKCPSLLLLTLSHSRPDFQPHFQGQHAAFVWAGLNVIRFSLLKANLLFIISFPPAEYFSWEFAPDRRDSEMATEMAKAPVSH